MFVYSYRNDHLYSWWFAGGDRFLKGVNHFYFFDSFTFVCLLFFSRGKNYKERNKIFKNSFFLSFAKNFKRSEAMRNQQQQHIQMILFRKTSPR